MSVPRTVSATREPVPPPPSDIVVRMDETTARELRLLLACNMSVPPALRTACMGGGSMKSEALADHFKEFAEPLREALQQVLGSGW